MIEVKKQVKNVQTLLMYSNATPIKCKGSIGYGCAFCNQEYLDAGDLKQHTLKAHDDKKKQTFMREAKMQKFLVKLDITGLKCALCAAEPGDVDCLKEHLRDVHDKVFYEGLKNHVVPFRFDDQDSIACVVCHHRFNNYKVLLEHMNAHYQNYVCDSCGTGFINKAILYQHSKRHEVGSEKCQFCDKVFKNKVQKQSHERAIHVCLNKRSKCGYCGEKFTDYAKKNDHVVKEHGGRATLVACQACDKVFQNQRLLSMHTKSYHLMQRKSRSKKQGKRDEGAGN